MDGPSSSSTAAKQPTYTTAGTIYRPSASQPLQPPARRGRATKLPLTSSHTEFMLLPRSVIAGLASRSPRLGSSARPQPQYTPLQQNYDRAVSPLNDHDHMGLNMAIQMPRICPDNPSAPLSFLLADKDDGDKGKAKVKTVADFYTAASESCVSVVAENGGDDNDDDDDDDDDVDDKINKNLMDNGLESTSEPLMSMRPLRNMNVPSIVSLGSYPNPMRRTARTFLRQSSRPNFTVTETLTAPLEDAKTTTSTGLLRPSQTDASDLGGPFTRLLPAALPNGDDSASSPTTSSLGTGPGVPLPLTAGPPGQRQYRPSTFESTVRALKTRTSFAKDDGDTLAALVAASEEERPLSRPFVPVAMSPLDYVTADSALDLGGGRYAPGTDRVSDEALQLRRERIDEVWYAGTGYLGMSGREVLAESAQRRKPHPYGAIGDGRPKKTKTEYGHMEVDEANSTPLSEDMAPLLNVALATLVRHVDDMKTGSPLQQFEPPKTDLCDATVEGNKSFFSKADIE
ncbi:hypothetical protein GQ602_006263 [Ophiocordyceps camponoti-floridani]|uniref:Uncharacterized protein n=1 Tax=Ophiocordyceps camponoti-floridani TaxID=2030778 RepID=A0A8H4VBM8_9HYPO|nr:hypothetical protein GQ602_006263 [Ophiocordyceps camponoti-floridani]